MYKEKKKKKEKNFCLIKKLGVLVLVCLFYN